MVASAQKADLERAVALLNAAVRTHRFELRHMADGWELLGQVKGRTERAVVVGPLSKPELYTWLKGFGKGLVWARIN